MRIHTNAALAPTRANANAQPHSRTRRLTPSMSTVNKGKAWREVVKTLAT